MENQKLLGVVCFVLSLIAIMPQKANAWGAFDDDEEEKQVFTNGRGTTYKKHGNVVTGNDGTQYIISGGYVSDSRGNFYTIAGRNVFDEKGNIICTINGSGMVDCHD